MFSEVVDTCTNLETLVLSGNYRTIADYGIEKGSIITVQMRSRGGKPVVLFYPPSEGPLALSEAFNVSTSVTLNPACRFTTLMPRPEMSGEENRITWNGIVENSHRNVSETTESSMISVYGRKHGYLFWEFTTDDDADGGDIVKNSIGVQSIIDHAENGYILNGMEEYEEWCHVMLSKIGLNAREQDDFATFWARNVYDCGPIVIARIVPERELSKCASLEVKAHISESEESEEIEVDIHRVYVTMVVCHSLPGNIATVTHKLQAWRTMKTRKTEDIPLPMEVSDTYPIKRDSKRMTVIEWGGVVITV